MFFHNSTISIANSWLCWKQFLRKIIYKSSFLQLLAYIYLPNLPIYLVFLTITIQWNLWLIILYYISSNCKFFKIIPPAETVYGNKIKNKIAPNIASALYTKYIGLSVALWSLKYLKSCFDSAHRYRLISLKLRHEKIRKQLKNWKKLNILTKFLDFANHRNSSKFGPYNTSTWIDIVTKKKSPL